MRFMILRMADAATEAGDLPTEDLLAEMGRYNEGLAYGAEAGLERVDALGAEPALAGYHLLPSVRGDLLLDRAAACARDAG